MPRDRREVTTWSQQEVRTFLEATRSSRGVGAGHWCWALALATGLRRSELLGLRWIDVDLEGGRLSVRRARVDVAYAVSERPPKNHRARVIALDPATVATLARHRRGQEAERLAAGPGFVDSGLVFTTPVGSPVHPQSVSWHFERAVKQSGLPRLTMHGCRHTHATLLLERGVPLTTVSERLGHSSVSVTGDIYSHRTEHAQAQAVGVMADILHGNAT